MLYLSFLGNLLAVLVYALAVPRQRLCFCDLAKFVCYSVGPFDANHSAQLFSMETVEFLLVTLQQSPGTVVKMYAFDL